MSHAFVSYAHTNRDHLQELIQWSQHERKRPINLWYDKQIEGGSPWRDEIAEALDEAFAVLVLVTGDSVKSMHCSYEWAYALGQGAPVIPLLFDDVPLTEIPSPLQTLQFVDCTAGIPEHLYRQLRGLDSLPPYVAAINQQIHDTIHSLHRRLFLFHWLDWEIQTLTDEELRYLLEIFVEDARDAKQTLSQIMLQHKPVMSGRQLRHCWTIVDILRKIARIQIDHLGHRPTIPEPILEDFDARWLSAAIYFDDYGWWQRGVQPYFSDKIHPDHMNTSEVITEIVRAFPQLDGLVAEIMVDNKRIYQKKKVSQTETTAGKSVQSD